MYGIKLYLGVIQKNKGARKGLTKIVFQHMVSNNGMFMNSNDDLSHMSMIILEIKIFVKG